MKLIVDRKLEKHCALLNQPWIVLVMLMVISVTAHMVYFHFRKSTLHIPVAGPYHGAASSLFSTRGAAIWAPASSDDSSLAYNPPMYTFFLAASYLTFGEDWCGVALMLSVVCGLVAFTVYCLARRVFSSGVGVLAGLWSIFYPYYFSQGSPPNIYETMLFTLFLLVSVWFLFQLQGKPSVKYALVGGFFLGLTALSRPNVVFVLPFLLAWFYLTSSQSTRMRVMLSVYLSIIFLAVLTPWTIRNQLVEGVPSPFGWYGKENTYKAYHPLLLDYYLGSGPFTDRYLQAKSSDQVYIQGPLWDEEQKQGMTAQQVAAWEESMPWLYWRQHPVQFLRLTAMKMIALWSWRLEPITLSRAKQAVYFLSYAPVLVLGLLGLWIFRDKWRQTSLFVMLFISFTLFAAITYGVTRYRAPLDAYLIIMAAAAIAYLFERMINRYFCLEFTADASLFQGHVSNQASRSRCLRMVL